MCHQTPPLKFKHSFASCANSLAFLTASISSRTFREGVHLLLAQAWSLLVVVAYCLDLFILASSRSNAVGTNSSHDTMNNRELVPTIAFVLLTCVAINACFYFVQINEHHRALTSASAGAPHPRARRHQFRT